ncbi:MAG TPA: APC family permease [Fimbriimonadaceae bacterium]|nr:APC family permease [Fimbriimonadaceae bacterium]
MSSSRFLKRRALSGTALLFAVFCCVSGGPFGLEPAVSEAGAGVALLLIVALPFLWALPDALTSCELAPAIPVEGGYVVWVRRALGPFAGFLNAWWTWIYTLVDAAIYPVLFATYLREVCSRYFGTAALDGEGVRWLVALAAIVTFTYLNFRGTKIVGRTSIILALLILVPFAAFVVAGLAAWKSGAPLALSLPQSSGGWSSSLAAGLGIVMWNYLGWDALSTVAGEVDQPQRAYPRALLGGLVIVTLAYLLPTLVGLRFMPNESVWVEGAWPAIAEAVGGPWIAGLMHVAALVSPIALFTASLLASSRVPMVLAEERFLPKQFGAVHPKFGTPLFSLTFSAVVFAVLASKTFQDLVVLNVLMYSAALVLETLALIVLRVKEPDLPRPFKIPGGWPVLCLLLLLPVGMAGTLAVLSIKEEGWSAQWLTIAALASGPVVYASIVATRRSLT